MVMLILKEDDTENAELGTYHANTIFIHTIN